MESSKLWKPAATREIWLQRQDLIQRIRSFFASQSVLEVETPTLSRAMGTDPHLDYLETRSFVDGTSQDSGIPLYLCTSPEFHMKRLLAAGWGDIWQLCKAFRGGESGPRHNPEFSILEWYRIGWDWNQLMNEVASLCACLAKGYKAKGAILASNTVSKISWRNAYQKHCGFDPLHVSLEDILAQASARHIPLLQNATIAEWLDYLMAVQIEPNLGKNGPEFLTHYPPEQAALAQLEQDVEGLWWARRFELYLDGIELCNGYQELIDPQEQSHRFEHDLELRHHLGKRTPPIDTAFLGALQAGMPACSGVALGFDRLVMLILGKQEIAEVLAFPIEKA